MLYVAFSARVEGQVVRQIVVVLLVVRLSFCRVGSLMTETQIILSLFVLEVQFIALI